MPKFDYLARDAATGREIQNVMTAGSEASAVALLLKRNFLVIRIEEQAKKRHRAHGGAVSLAELVIFTRQFATMVDAGLEIIHCLQALGEQTTNRYLRSVIADVSTSVEGGDDLSTALMKHPRVFNKLYVHMVEAGEKGGLLAEVLARLATYLETTARLRKKVKSALMYPVTVSVIAIAITVFLLVRVVPVFAQIYEGLGGQLPAPTQFLIIVSGLLKDYFVYLAPLACLLGYGWLSFIKTKKGREFWDGIRIKLPIVGPIAHKLCLTRFARTLSSLIRSGVPILDVLEMTAGTCGNVIMANAIRRAATDIQTGEAMANALVKHPIFPAMVIRMLAAGEQTGRIDAMLERVADFLDDELDATLSGLTSLIEPILIVVLGVIVGTIVICMFMPIFKLTDLINQAR